MLTQPPIVISRLPTRPMNQAGYAVLRRYLGVMAVGNLVWETAQLPLYTLWWTSSPLYLAFVVLHCWIGDLVIGTITMLVGIGAAGSSWPLIHVGRAMFVTLAAGVAYTAFSEWLNVTVRGTWAYSAAMPVLPVLGTGLSPLLQWLVVPGIALLFAYRPILSTGGTRR